MFLERRRDRLHGKVFEYGNVTPRNSSYSLELGMNRQRMTPKTVPLIKNLLLYILGFNDEIFA